eukprot:GHVU01032678.1.p2 GENE.GHVU01032678.1~~GHVU01032678.1.p2  ORF type:complete len:140 (+),score=16.62 GHVU01032678.1:574-993(+)
MDAQNSWAKPSDVDTFFVSSVARDRRLKSNFLGFPGQSKSRMGWEIWRIMDQGSGVFHIKSKAHGHYLGSTPDGSVMTRRAAQGWECWKIMKSANGSVSITSVAHGRQLALDDRHQLQTVHGGKSGSELWKLEPHGSGG